MAKINDGTLKDWKDGDKVTSDLYEADREILRVANNDNHDRIVTLEVDKPIQDKRLDDLEYNVTGTVVPMTFKELGMQNLTFDDIKLGYVDQAIAKAWKPSLDTLTRGIVEESTATDGQTVVNLTNSYTVGGNQITVEIDGVPQDETSYTETSTTSITLSEALVAGQRVVVTIGKVDPNADARFSSMGDSITSLTSSLADITSKTERSGGFAQNIAVTLDNSGNHSTFTSWQGKLANVNCGVQLAVMEYIASDTGYVFTSITNRDSLIADIVATVGKKIDMLKPHIGTNAQGDSFYRGGYTPSDTNAFFVNWKAKLLEYASLCNTYNIPKLSLSCEQTVLTNKTYLAKWQDVINTIKASYPNLKLAFAYTFDEFTRDMSDKGSGNSVLSDYVDIIGYNCYTDLYRTNLDGSMYRVISRYDHFSYISQEDMILNAKKLFNKPIEITETGCTFYTDGSSKMLYPIYIGTIQDTTDQKLWIDAIMDYFCNNKNLNGVTLWHINSPFAVLDDVNVKNIIKSYFGEV
jgi:hypothetical protein